MDPRRLVLVWALVLVSPSLFAQLSSDNFDSYSAGSSIAGQGDWETWDNNPGVDAEVSNLFANTLPNSLELQPNDDIVRRFNGINQGSFTLTSQVYTPSGQSGQYYYILLNTYDASGVGYNWSAQILISDLTGVVTDLGGSSAPTAAATPQPIQYDTWVNVSVEVDLTANTYSAFYDGIAIMTGNTWAIGVGVPRLQAIDLYNAAGGTFYYDDVSVDCTGGCGGCLPFDTLGCTLTSNDVTLDWTTFQVGGYASGISIVRNGIPITALPGTATSYLDVGAPAGLNSYEVIGDCGTQTWSVTCDIEILELFCSDGVDNDLDGLADCADPDCAIPCDESLNCADFIDNDLDGDIDCLDVDCALDLACAVAPPNDDCVNATAVGAGTFTFQNIIANLDGSTACDANMTGDVWFMFTPTTTGTVSINTCGSAGSLVDTTLIIYDGSLGCPLPGDIGLACDDDTCASAASANPFMSRVITPVISGTPILVQVGGWNGSTGDSVLNIEFIESVCDDGLDDDLDGLIDCDDPDCTGAGPCIVQPPTAMLCADNGVDTVTATWSPTVAGPGLDSQNVYVDGVFVATVLAGDTTWPVTYGAGFVGVIQVCVESVFGAGTSVQACCAVGIGGPANDNCANAEIATLGVQVTGNLIAATNDGTAACGASAANPDAWYEFTAPADGTYVFSTCGTHDGFGGGQDLGMDTVLALNDVCGGLQLACNDDNGAPTCSGADTGILRDSVVSLAMVSGQSVLARVSHFGATISTGEYLFQVTQDCGNLGVATCVADAGAGTVTVSWTDNIQATAGYEIFENGVSVGTTPAGSSSFIVAAPTPGLNNYNVTWICALSGVAGSAATCSATVNAPIPAGTTDVIIKNEGILDGGNLGAIDSGAALALALTNAGSAVFTVSTADFDAAGLDFSIPARIWLCLGTFPNDYRITVAEGDLLATLNAGGTGIYFEGGDHWGFIHTVTGFDTRDGVSTALDGDDTFTAMNPVTGNTVADLTAFAPGIVYNQDQAGNDWTDQLTLATADLDVSLAESMWTQAGGAYVTAIYAEHTSGANSIVSSWEFGGFGGDQDALAAAYLGLIGGVAPPVGDQFVRANCNADAATNIADAIFALGILFPGPNGPNIPLCAMACDANDDNALNIADAIFILGILFPGPSGPPVLPAPVTCGVDPTPGGLLTCDAFPPCVP